MEGGSGRVSGAGKGLAGDAGARPGVGSSPPRPSSILHLLSSSVPRQRGDKLQQERKRKKKKKRERRKERKKKAGEKREKRKQEKTLNQLLVACIYMAH